METLLIDDCMVPSPYAIQLDENLATAHSMMETYAIRHLPVLDGTQLVGLVSIRDLHVLESAGAVDKANVPVSAAMSPNPYTVPAGTPLREVVATMGAHKYGSAIVVRDEEVVGMFTTVDAMRVLFNLL